jgi:regulator of protease activity HflC (stomatin/prohibitin superfamily)
VVYSDKRKEASERIAEGLKKQLGDRGIVLEELLLRNVELPPNLRDSIEQKLQAEQEAQKMEFVLEKEKKEKERKIIEAEGQRESQRIINESLTDRFLNYQYIKNLENREGTIYVPTDGNGLPMFKNIE